MAGSSNAPRLLNAMPVLTVAPTRRPSMSAADCSKAIWMRSATVAAISQLVL